MTLNEFFVELERLPSRWRWYCSTGSIRSADMCCPITEVYQGRTEEYFPPGSAHQLGRRLGLGPKITQWIIDASDNRTPTCDTHRNIRRRLIEACGLKNP